MKKMNRLLMGLLSFLIVACAPLAEKDFTQYVDPTIGNVAPLLVPTKPTFSQPNQMLRMFPVRADYIDDCITYFPLQVMSHRANGIVPMKPWVGTVDSTAWRARVAYDHDLEVIRPWFYSTYLLDLETTVSFTPGKKAAIYRIDFPSTNERHLLFTSRSGNVDGAGVNGMYLTENYSDMKVYFYAELVDESGNPVTGCELVLDRDGRLIDVVIPSSAPKSVELRYAVSYIDLDQARKNMQDELAGKSFAQLQEEAHSAWAGRINQIEVVGSEANKRTFYTALYRYYERMIDITEDGKYYSGYDKQIHEATTHPFYVDDWVWDTYLAAHPLRLILDPDMEVDMLNSYLLMYEQSGWLPQFPQVDKDSEAMNGFHSSIIFVDAYFKGVRDWDHQKAFEAMVNNFENGTRVPWRGGEKCSLDDFYKEKGFFPALHPGEKETEPKVHPFEARQSVAVTLGHSYDDWALSKFATELGKNEMAEIAGKAAQNYRNLWDPNFQLFMPKDKDGKWIPIDPRFDGGPGFRAYYDENNAYTFAWQAQHDINGLIELLGGKEKAAARLDNLFREPLGMSKYQFWAIGPDATGIVGQFNMGNEPSFHIPYLYNYFGQPWKTQQRIRFLLDVWYKDNIFGIPGDEDGGGMSAFVVFSCMGFYPVVLGEPIYTIGSPVFEKSVINLPNGKKFTMIANNCSKVNKYIQSATINGAPLNKPFFTHDDLTGGATIVLEMGPLPNKQWGVE